MKRRFQGKGKNKFHFVYSIFKQKEKFDIILDTILDILKEKLILTLSRKLFNI